MDFKNWMLEKVNEVDKYLSSIIKNNDNNPQNIIYESMNYSLMSGGKRLRPILLLGAYEIFNSDYEKAMPFACAMEMIHTYSLIHDDLPAMDDDDYRRGNLSNHKKYNEAIAILAGDGLLNKAFEVGLEASMNSGLDCNKAIKALSIIANSSGTEGMIGGQIVDMAGEEKIHNIDDLKYMYSLKTGAIIKSSIEAGAILGGASKEEINALSVYAEKLGIAFQIQDDILDVEGSEELIGKPIGSDEANNKKTYVSYVGLEQAKKYVQKYSDEAIESLNIFGSKANYLIELAKYLTNRDH